MPDEASYIIFDRPTGVLDKAMHPTRIPRILFPPRIRSEPDVLQFVPVAVPGQATLLGFRLSRINAELRRRRLRERNSVCILVLYLIDSAIPVIAGQRHLFTPLSGRRGIGRVNKVWRHGGLQLIGWLKGSINEQAYAQGHKELYGEHSFLKHIGSGNCPPGDEIRNYVNEWHQPWGLRKSIQPFNGLVCIRFVPTRGVRKMKSGGSFSAAWPSQFLFYRSNRMLC